MNWRKIPKGNAIQPQTGTYKNWKPQLAEEGFHQCVYCAIPDAAMGGIRNFHVEHYRPKAKHRFPELENTYANLFYACPICNTFKGSDWPAEPDHKKQSYLDPSVSEYSQLFTINLQSGEVYSDVVASRYMIEKIHLNRGQLIMERRLHNMFGKAGGLRNEIEQLLEHLPNENALNLLHRYTNILSRMHDLRDQLQTITPYQTQDVQRP